MISLAVPERAVPGRLQEQPREVFGGPSLGGPRGVPERSPGVLVVPGRSLEGSRGGSGEVILEFFRPRAVGAKKTLKNIKNDELYIFLEAFLGNVFVGDFALLSRRRRESGP